MNAENAGGFMIDKIKLVKDSKDPCEWNPYKNTEAFDNDIFHSDAKVLVGKNGYYRLCKECSQLKRFSRYKKISLRNIK